MATIVDLKAQHVRDILQVEISRLERGLKTTKTPQFEPIYDQMIAELKTALSTVREQKDK